MASQMVAFGRRQLANVRVIGKEIRWAPPSGSPNPIPGLWDQCFRDGTIARLQKRDDLLEPHVLTGWMGKFDPSDHSFSYIVSVLARPGAPVPDGCVGVDVPAHEYAFGTMAGTEPDIYMNARGYLIDRLISERLESDPSFGTEFEWYDERFMANPDRRVIDYLIPLK